jgi:TfoX/Sxy family transcriptional regulator of competence genes
MNCPKCGLLNNGNMAVGLAMPQCMCQWQSTQEKSRIETVPAQGTLLPKHEWVGLTEQDIEAAYWQTNPSLERFAHAIEAKLKEKNT